MALRDEVAAGADIDAWLRDSFAAAGATGFDVGVCGSSAAAASSAAASLDPQSLEVSKGGEVVETIELGSSALVVIGKHSECDVQLEHPSISRRHAAIVQTSDQGLLLIDLSSKAGTALDGKRVPPSLGVPLRDGQAVNSADPHARTRSRLKPPTPSRDSGGARLLPISRASRRRRESEDTSLFGLLPKEKAG